VKNFEKFYRRFVFDEQVYKKFVRVGRSGNYFAEGGGLTKLFCRWVIDLEKFFKRVWEFGNIFDNLE
jgi:hypothetical protein